MTPRRLIAVLFAGSFGTLLVIAAALLGIQTALADAPAGVQVEPFVVSSDAGVAADAGVPAPDARPPGGLANPVDDPIGAYSDARAALEQGWAVFVLAVIVMTTAGLSRAAGRWPNARLLAWFVRNKTAIYIVAGVGTVAAAALDALWLGGTWYAAGYAALGAFLTLVAPQPSSPRTAASPRARAAVTLLLVALVAGCHGTKSAAGRMVGDAFDCLAPTAAETVAAFVPAMSNVIRNATDDRGQIDWGPVRDSARPLKTRVQQCVVAAALAEVLRPREPDPEAPQSAGLEVDAAAARTGFRALSLELFGGARFRVAGDTL